MDVAFVVVVVDVNVAVLVVDVVADFDVVAVVNVAFVVFVDVNIFVDDVCDIDDVDFVVVDNVNDVYVYVAVSVAFVVVGHGFISFGVPTKADAVVVHVAVVGCVCSVIVLVVVVFTAISTVGNLHETWVELATRFTKWVLSKVNIKLKHTFTHGLHKCFKINKTVRYRDQ